MKKTPRRGRPQKAADQRKDVDLRIPVTAEQKELVSNAATLSGEDMASWARPILLAAAERAFAQDKKTKIA